jgi:hypothetical protein
MHGGTSTGPKSAEGRERCRLARWKHGFYANAAVAERRRVRAVIAECAKLLRALRAPPEV